MIETITGIHGVPRSGTSWLFQILNSSNIVTAKFQPLFSYEFKDFLTPESNSLDFQNFFKKIYNSDNYFLNMKDKDIHKNYPLFEKKEIAPNLCFKHVRYHHLIETFLKNNKQVKFILIVRNPLAVLSSWKNAPREFSPKWDFNEEWLYAKNKNQDKLEEFFGYTKWKEAALLFHRLEKNYASRVKLISYKELLSNTDNVVKSIFKFCDIPFSQEVERFIIKSKSIKDNNPNSVYKIKKEDTNWKNNISSEIQNKVEMDLRGSELEIYLN